MVGKTTLSLVNPFFLFASLELDLSLCLLGQQSSTRPTPARDASRRRVPSVSLCTCVSLRGCLHLHRSISCLPSICLCLCIHICPDREECTSACLSVRLALRTRSVTVGMRRRLVEAWTSRQGTGCSARLGPRRHVGSLACLTCGALLLRTRGWSGKDPSVG